MLHNNFAIFVFLDAFGNDQHKEVIHVDLLLQTRVEVMNCHILKFFTIKWNSLLVGHSVSFFFFFRFTYTFLLIFSLFSFFYLHFIGEDHIFFFNAFFILDIFLALNKMILVKTALSILFAKLSCLKRSYNFNHV